MNRKFIKEIVIDALFLALIVIFSYVPYIGLITIGPISFTTIHLIVLIAGVLFPLFDKIPSNSLKKSN